MSVRAKKMRLPLTDETVDRIFHALLTSAAQQGDLETSARARGNALREIYHAEMLQKMCAAQNELAAAIGPKGLKRIGRG